MVHCLYALAVLEALADAHVAAAGAARQLRVPPRKLRGGREDLAISLRNRLDFDPESYKGTWVSGIITDEEEFLSKAATESVLCNDGLLNLRLFVDVVHEVNAAGAYLLILAEEGQL